MARCRVGGRAHPGAGPGWRPGAGPVRRRCGRTRFRAAGPGARRGQVPAGRGRRGCRLFRRRRPQRRPRGWPLPLPGSAPEAPPALGVRPAGLREAGTLLGDRDAGLFTQAVALANWHATHTRCPRDGTPTEPVSAGHARRCPTDGSEHFPRVDPAVIMLVTDDDDRCLLARNRRWPPRRVSILAGFVEPGESVEHALVREVSEETGLLVSDLRYVGSQPWPFPQSLMLGFRARAHGNQEIRVDGEEIAEARWFTREQLRAAIPAGEVLLPPPVSIAHRIIESWYGGPLPGSW